MNSFSLGNLWRAHPIRNERLLQIGSRGGGGVIGVPPGGTPPGGGIEPDWNFLLGSDTPKGNPSYRPTAWGAHMAYKVVAQTEIATFGLEVPGAVKGSTTYFFDAVLRADHSHTVEVTHHPVQTGASVSDHAIVEPSRLTLNVGFSDVLDRYQSTDYSPGSSKSVSAWAVFTDLQQQRQPLTVFTRLQQYDNMILTEIHTTEDNRTFASLRMNLVFQQVIMATISTEIVASSSANSQRDQVTGANKLGAKPVTTPPSTATPYKVDPTKTQSWGVAKAITGFVKSVLKVIDAGSYSSTPAKPPI